MRKNTRLPAKILYTVPNFITAGTGNALFNVARRLNPERFAPTIGVLKTGGRLVDQVIQSGIPILELPFTVAPRPLYNLPSRLWRSARLFRSHHFAIWHSYHYSDDYTEPIIAKLSGAKAWIYVKKNMSWGSRAWRMRTRLATRVIAINSTMLKLYFQSRQDKRKVRLIPLTVDPQLFRPRMSPDLNLRLKLGIDSAKLIVGCVANIERVKDQSLLIKAIAQLSDIHVAFAGKFFDQEYYQELQLLCAQMGVQDRVHFLGDISNIPALHAEMDIFVLPTSNRLRSEALGLALLEAMACGIPSIATEAPGPKDIIEPNVSGLLVPPEDVQAMVSALQQLIASPDLRHRLGIAARQRVLDHYTIEREVAAHEALYAELLNL